MEKLPKRYENFRAEFSAISRAYDELAGLAAKAGPVDEKTAQLVKLGMAIAAGLEGAVHSHARRALQAGATRDEVRHVGMLALTTVGFPRMIAGLSWIDDTVKGGLGGRRRGESKRRR
jgi:alkylhydroperoxidase/carboxymuconolactone decarboxylase family protein YurZ